MHISYLSLQQKGYKRNQIQYYLLNRWKKKSLPPARKYHWIEFKAAVLNCNI